METLVSQRIASERSKDISKQWVHGVQPSLVRLADQSNALALAEAYRHPFAIGHDFDAWKPAEEEGPSVIGGVLHESGNVEDPTLCEKIGQDAQHELGGVDCGIGVPRVSAELELVGAVVFAFPLNAT